MLRGVARGERIDARSDPNVRPADRVRDVVGALVVARVNGVPYLKA